MATSGEGTSSNGSNYDWKIVGFGEPGNRWYERSPSAATIQKNIANPDFRMTIEVTHDSPQNYRHADDREREGYVHYFMIHGGYDLDDLPDIVDREIEDY